MYQLFIKMAQISYSALKLFLIKIKIQWFSSSNTMAAIYTCSYTNSNNFCCFIALQYFTVHGTDIFIGHLKSRLFCFIALHLQHFITNSFIIIRNNSIVFCYLLPCYAFNLSNTLWLLWSFVKSIVVIPAWSKYIVNKESNSTAWSWYLHKV